MFSCILSGYFNTHINLVLFVVVFISCGKTTSCQMFAALAGHKFFSVNCHLHLETSDFLGGLRPVRHTGQVPVNLFKKSLWKKSQSVK